MKNLICLLAFIIFSLTVFGQQSSLNIYSNWSYFPGQSISHLDNDFSKIGYNGLSFSYRKANEKLNFQEYELKTGLRFKKESTQNTKKIYNHIRYEIGKQKEEKLFNTFTLQYGFTFKLFQFYEQIDPQAIDMFTIKHHTLGLSAGLLTNIEYDLSSNLYVQLKVTLFDIMFRMGTSENDRPDIANELRKVNNFDIDLLGEQSLRFGIGYKIGKK